MFVPKHWNYRPATWEKKNCFTFVIFFIRILHIKIKVPRALFNQCAKINVCPWPDWYIYFIWQIGHSNFNNSKDFTNHVYYYHLGQDQYQKGKWLSSWIGNLFFIYFFLFELSPLWSEKDTPSFIISIHFHKTTVYIKC